MSLVDMSTSAWDSLKQRESSIRQIPIDDIRIDPQFQRAVVPSAVTKVKCEFHPKGVGLILIAGVDPEDSAQPRWACIDGQTRLRAMLELESEIAQGIRSQDGFSPIVTAEVFEDLTRPEAALLFRLRNQQKAVPTKDRDRILVIEGDPIMNEVVRQSAIAGYVVFDDDPEGITMPYRTEAKRIITWEHKYHTPSLLTKALTIQATAFETPEGTLVGTLQPKVLEATAWLLCHNSNLLDDELVRVMSAIGLAPLQATAESRAASEGTQLMRAVRSVLVDRYNKGKRNPAEKIKP